MILDMKARVEYRGFHIVNDRILGFSLIQKNGIWICSVSTKEKAKNLVNEILN